MRSKLRVCFPFVGDTVGGSHISTILLIESLRCRNIEPIVVLHCDGLLSEQLRSQNVPFTKAPNVRLVDGRGTASQFLTMLGCALPLRAFLIGERIDLIHTNDAKMHLSWLLPAKIAGVRHVWHQRTLSRRLGIYGSSADAYLTISEYCRTPLFGKLRKRALVLDNPFDTVTEPPDRDVARSRLLQELNASSDTFLVGFVGNMLARKRPGIFVKMANILRQRTDRPIKCLMIGERRAKEDQIVSSLIESLALSDTCIRLGQRFPIEPVLAGFDVLVVPAVGEPFGRVLVEGMLAGTPVIAADDGGHREIIDTGATGVLVPKDDAEAFADAVENLLKNSELRHQIAKNAVTAARARFSVERHCETVVSIYRELVPNPKT